MKNFDELCSIWEDYDSDESNYDITLMTRGIGDLIISINNISEDNIECYYDLSNIEIVPLSNDNFEILYIDEDGLKNHLSGKHPIDENEDLMILDIPDFEGRKFKRKVH